MSQRSFEEVWRFIGSLKVKEIRTLSQGAQNTILNVTRNHVDVERVSTKKRFRAYKRWFEEVWKELGARGVCEFPRGHRRIIYAILACLPEVEYSTYPVTLYLMSQPTHPFCKRVKREA